MQGGALLDDPAQFAKTGAVFGAAAGDEWCDSEFTHLGAVFVVVVAAVGVDLRRPGAGPSALPRIGGIAGNSGRSGVTTPFVRQVVCSRGARMCG